MDISLSVWPLRLVILFALFQQTQAIICPHCTVDFVCLARHTWRCRARITGGGHAIPPQAPVATPSSPSSLNGESLSGGHSPSSSEWKCVCGRVCRGRRGLRSHQRACRTFAALSSGLSEINNPPTINSPRTETSPSACETVTNSPTQPVDSSTLPDIKLPTRPAQWTEANAYFATSSELYNSPIDVSKYTGLLQSTIYNYFATNYGL